MCEKVIYISYISKETFILYPIAACLVVTLLVGFCSMVRYALEIKKLSQFSGKEVDYKPLFRFAYEYLSTVCVSLSIIGVLYYVVYFFGVRF